LGGTPPRRMEFDAPILTIEKKSQNVNLKRLKVKPILKCPLQLSICFFLTPYILLNNYLVQSRLRYTVPLGTKPLSHEVHPSPEQSRHMDCALAFNKPDHLGYRLFLGNRDQYVFMICYPLPFHNLALLLLGQYLDYGSLLLAKRSIEKRPTILRNYYHVALATLCHMP
jgi:hypothetical protein